MKYFKNCKNLNELKSEFRKLCKTLHPDKGGKQADFVEMTSEFKAVSDKLKFNTGFEADKDFNASKFYDLVQKFEGLNDININFIGSFIWLTDIEHGAMYEQKNAIKGIKIEGLNVARWANKKKSWYFSPSDYKQKGSSKKSLEALKSTYGGTTYATKQTIKLKA